ncbi:coiled-coil domain-containing protein 43 [Petromyzon marinus]|uniref:Coiled-coil domain-containing protein 43 n=1 Tax=Petromyzon marinus TaxID=7757 RepID=A0AAJ7U590_PETMA|nr:coiled-coil domain-containing protein 43 [Petromyzon marinus]
MAESDFAPWLSRRLEAMQVEAEVYGSYLAGILGEEDDSDEEKEEAMRAVLSAVVAEEDSLDSICREILRKWREMDHLSKERRRLLNGSRDEVQVLASMIEQQAQLVVQPREVTREERQRKEALLAQYATVEEAEDEESEETEGATAAKPAGVTDKSKSLFRNTNAETVAEKQRLQREQAREDSQRKKEQDKTQREKDKVQKQEKKDEKRKKAQKVERRR